MRIGLALVSGGPQGLSRVGVLTVLLSHSIQPDITSAQEVGGIDWNSFWKPAQVIAGGERATLGMLARILQVLRR